MTENELRSCMEKKDWDGVRKAIAEANDLQSLLLRVNGDLWTPLYNAITHKAPEKLILEMIDACEDAAFIKTTSGNTALHNAAECCDSYGVIRALVKANPMALDHRNANNKTPRDALSKASPDGRTRELLQNTASQFLRAEPRFKCMSLEKQLSEIESKIMLMRQSIKAVTADHAKKEKELRERIGSLEKELLKAEAQGVNLQETVASRDDTISTLKRRLDQEQNSSSKRIKVLEENLTTIQKNLSQVETKHAQAEEKCNSLQNLITEKDKEMTRLNKTSTDSAARHQASTQQWTAKIDELHKTLLEKEATIAELKTASQKEKTMKAWTEQLEELHRLLSEKDQMIANHVTNHEQKQKENQAACEALRKQLEGKERDMAQLAKSANEAVSKSEQTMGACSNKLEEFRQILSKKEELMADQLSKAAKKESDHAQQEKQLAHTIKEKDAEISRLTQSLKKTATENEKRVTEWSHKMEHLHQQLSEKERTIVELRAASKNDETLNAWSEKMDKLHQSLSEKDKDIEKLRQSVLLAEQEAQKWAKKQAKAKAEAEAGWFFGKLGLSVPSIMRRVGTLHLLTLSLLHVCSRQEDGMEPFRLGKDEAL